MDREKKIIDQGTLPITVTKEVIGHLSIGLYRNFARAIKELISNAYDASATEVKIKLDFDSSPTRIIIRDNGQGMNKGDVKNKFLKIGTPTPIDEKIGELGRKRIGTFGIGCISVFPYCSTVKVISKKREEDKIIEVTIDSSKFFKAGTFDLGADEKSDVPYQSYESDLPIDQGETIIILEDLKEHIVNELKHEEQSGISSIEKYGGLQKFKWSLSQYIPIEFPDSRKDLKELFQVPNRVSLRVWVNGEELFRNVPRNASILEKGEKEFDGIIVKYAIMTPLEPVRPGESKGLQIRMRDVAIGLPTDFNIISLTGKVPGKLNWICGEIHILKGLSSYLMIDRDSFSFTEEVASLHEFFRKKLRHWNDKLEKWASEDKEIYKSILELEQSDKIIDELKRKGVLRIPKERLKIKKADIVKSPKKEIFSTKEELKRTLSKSDYEVVYKKGFAPKKKPLLEVDSKTKTILIHEDHPDLKETIKVGSERYMVEYDKWELGETPFDLCRIKKDQKVVVFNSQHPLFKSKLDDDIIKKLAVGIFQITKGREDEDVLVEKLNQLLTEVFLG